MSRIAALVKSWRIPFLRSRSEPGVPVLVLGISGFIALLGALASWYAGMQYGQLQYQQVTSQLADSQRHVANLQFDLQRERAKAKGAEKALKMTGTPAAAHAEDALRQRIQRLEAEVNQYQAAINRDQKRIGDNLRLISLLSAPGVRMIPLKSSEPNSIAVGYLLISADSKATFVAANLPNVPASSQYQLWLFRTEEPKVVSAGSFTPDTSGRTIFEFLDAEFLTNLSGAAVTVESADGSTTPSSNRLLSATIE